jgi:hypothetical protein
LSWEQKQNPFSPPAATIADPLEELFEDGGVMRNKDLLFINNRAALPGYCFVTGEPTKLAVDVEQRWQPRWAAWLLLLFILPYFFITPFLRRRVMMHVPISPAVYQRHCRLVGAGFRLLFSAAVLLIASFLLGGLTLISVMVLLACAALGCVGFILSSRQPLRLDIVSMDDNLLVLRGVHPNFLAQIPDIDEDQLAVD